LLVLCGLAPGPWRLEGGGSANACELYPIALSWSTLNGLVVGDTISNIFNGTHPGNFGWLTWTGDASANALGRSLRPPGNSDTYRDPDDRNRHSVRIGCWIPGKPGVANSEPVRAALDSLKERAIIVPVWNQTRGQGQNVFYRVATFARVRLLDYQLPKSNRLTVQFLGYVTCGAENLPPQVDAGPDQTIIPGAGANLKGAANDDGFPVGAPLAMAWSIVNGPGSVTFANPNSAVTSAVFGAPGIYVLRLTANDSELAATDDIIITVKSPNQPPVVDAGPDQTNILGTPLSLNAQVADDGLPLGAQLTVVWSVDSGPGAVSFSDREAPETTAQFSAPGVYVLRLTASDSELSASDDVTISVLQPNRPPVVSAGQNLWIKLPNTAALNGNVSDDGLPTGAALTIAWTTVSGPEPVAFGDSASARTTAAFGAPGNYVLRLTATDSELTASADVTVIVSAAAVNQPPMVDAGPDKVVGLTNVVTLDGTVADDGLPAGAASTVAWSLVAGPGEVTFDNPGLAKTKATFNQLGTYILRLTANDSAFTTSDEVTITVYPHNLPPTVDAGPDQTIWVPDPAVLTLTGIEPTNTSLALSPSIFAVEHWTNRVGQPGLTGIPPGAWAVNVAQQSIAAGGNDIFVGGKFLQAGGQLVNGLARWDGANWFPLYDPSPSNPTNSASPPVGFVTDTALPLTAVAARGHEVFAAGGFLNDFSFPKDGQLDLTARWNGSNWVAWNFKLLSPVVACYSLVATPDAVYVGGSFKFQPTNFTTATITNLPISFNLAKWDGNNWATLGDGIRDIRDSGDPKTAYNYGLVNAIAIGRTGEVYAAGSFVMNTPTGPATNIAKWNGQQWAPLDGGLAGCNLYYSCSTRIYALAVTDDGTLYAGGDFTLAGGATAYHVARWDGAGWAPLLSGSDNGLTTTPVALAAHGHDVYVAGMFGRVGGVTAAGIAKWNGQFWTALGTGMTNGVYGSVAALATTARGLFVAGQFSQAGGLAANNIAEWEFPPLPTETVFLRGSVSDDGLPSGALLDVNWTKLSGPGDVVFADLHHAITTVTFSRAGSYVLRLTASDSDLTSLDDTTVVIRANQAPVVDAGDDQAVGLSEAAVLNGSVIDDGLPEGATLAAAWSVISGPGPVTFGDSHATATTATFGAIGTYVLRLGANDSQFSASDEMVVTVQPANTPPYIDPHVYGPVTLPNAGTLSGYARDDGLPIGKLTVAWSQVSGPAPAIFANANSAVTTATFTQPGTYVFAFTANDSELTTRAELSLQVLGNPVANTDPNLAPSVDAGADQSVATRGAARLTGAVADDGLPAGAPLTAYWSMVTGPGRVYFMDTRLAATTATFSTAGSYHLRLTANDSRLSASDDVVITVFTPTNEPPLVFAGLDVSIVRPEVAHLFGTALDDGLPAGHPLQVAWSKISGPGSVTFTPSPNDLFVDAAFSAPGAYVLRLSAGDSQFVTTDDIAIDVHDGVNSPPKVDAGPDFVTVLSGDTVLNGKVSDDGLPNGTLETSWSQITGPAPVQFSSVNGAYHAAFAASGNYLLRLTANDSELTASDDVAVAVYDVPEPPVVAVTAPVDADVVTAPTVIRGTVDSPILQSWTLAYRLKSSDVGAEDSAFRHLQSAFDWVAFATGTNAVVDGPLGTFDPTLLLNGLYEIELSATDLVGRFNSTNFTLIVDRNLKIGNFTLSFNDLAVPLAGLPIQIIRTYDSRDKRTNDFGVGWSLEIKNIRLQKNRHLGRNWQETTTAGDFPVYTIETPKPRIVTITFPDGKVHKFQATPSPRAAFAIPIEYPVMDFVPLDNTTGSLQPATGNQLVFGAAIPGTGDFLDWELLLDPPPGPADNLLFNPTLFNFSSQEGYVYLIDEKDGLKRITDPSGNTLTITTNGLIHSSGKSVRFQRDEHGRITGITDPAGNSMTYRYDTNGDLVAFSDRESNTNAFTYDGRHNLLALLDPRGVQPLRNEYDDAGRLIRHIDAFGKVVNYQHDLGNRQEIVTDRLGNITIHEYDERGNVVRSADANGGVTSSGYDDHDNLVAQTNALGQVIIYTYDELDNRTSATDPLGNITRFTYGPRRRVLTAVDPRGNTITNTYDEHGSLLSIRDPLGNFTNFGYDQRGLPDAMTNAFGQVTRYEYDGSGNLTNETDPLDHLTAYTRDENGNLSTQTTTRTRTDAAGLPVVETLTVTFQYDRQNRLTNTVFPDGSATATIYNSLGKPAVTIDQLGHQTSYDYDDLGRLTRTVYPDGSSDGSAYDAEGRRVASTNRLGRVSGYNYDALGRLVRTIYPDGTTTTNFYDLVGQTIASTDARGHTTFFGYDDVGRTIAVTNALGYVTTSAYDEAGNLASTTDALGRTTRYIYDALNRRTQTLFFGSADSLSAGSGGVPEPLSSTRTTYDALGHRSAQTDQAGLTTWFGYDAAGRLTSVTNALGFVTAYAYDELGEQIAQSDANQHTTTFEYDSLGHRVKRTLPGGQFESCDYDFGGLLTTKTDFNGFTTTYTYDTLGRLLQKSPDARLLSVGSTPVSFTYNLLGQRLSMTDASGQSTYAYDDRDRLVTKTKIWTSLPQVSGSAGVSPAQFSVSLNYSYDSNGNVTGIQTSSLNGASIAYEYDALNRLSAVNDPILGRTEYQYDNVGNLASLVYPNVIQSSYLYDSLNRLTNVAVLHLPSSILASFSYALAPAGNRLAEQLTTDHGLRTASYGYDDLYRLKQESISLNAQPSSLNYSYDPAGNRLSRRSTLITPASTNSSYDANDRLTSDTYDANGNTIQSSILNPPSSLSPSPTSDAYDFENHLVTRLSPFATNRFLYDGDGNRAAKTLTTASNSVTTCYLVDDRNPTGYPQVLEEFSILDPQSAILPSSADPSPSSSVPQLSRVYTWGLFLISQDQLLTNQWVVSFYGFDGHGSVRFLTDALGQVTDTYDYDAFGNLIAQTAAGGTPTPNLYLFAGEQFDPDLGLYYLRARYANPDTGRFWSMDGFEGSSADPLSLHKYVYCANNPVNRVDPSGESYLMEMGVSASISEMMQVAMGALNRGLAAYVDGLRWGDVGRNAFNGSALSSDAQAGFAGGLLGCGIGKAAFWGVAKGAPMLLNNMPEFAFAQLNRAYAAMDRAYAGMDGIMGRLGTAIAKGDTAAFRGEAAALAKAELAAEEAAAAVEEGEIATGTRSAVNRGIVVVGENMKRVQEIARRLESPGVRVHIYRARNMTRASNPNSYGSAKSLDADWHWLDYWAREKQIDVIDIGLEPGRIIASPYYAMESRNLVLWEVAGKIRSVIRIDPGF
jgi:RHS repeat-associated protein